jgi:hypothetical protein
MRFISTIAVPIAVLAFTFQAAAQTVSIKTADCAHLVRHVAQADVAFRPGEDLQGRFVVPADTRGSVKVEIPRKLAIPITVDLQRRLGIPVDPNLYQTQNFSVGTVVWENGKGYFNGQPLHSEEAEKLAALCQKQLLSGRW